MWKLIAVVCFHGMLMTPAPHTPYETCDKYIENTFTDNDTNKNHRDCSQALHSFKHLENVTIYCETGYDK